MIISNKNIVLGVKCRDYAVSESKSGIVTKQDDKFITTKSGKRIIPKQNT